MHPRYQSTQDQKGIMTIRRISRHSRDMYAATYYENGRRPGRHRRFQNGHIGYALAWRVFGQDLQARSRWVYGIDETNARAADRRFNILRNADNVREVILYEDGVVAAHYVAEFQTVRRF